LLYAIFLSFFGGRGTDFYYVGFGNYWDLSQDETFIATLDNTIIFTIIIVPIILCISIFLALSIYKVKSKIVQDIFITLLYIPCVTSPVAYALFFKQMAYSDGVLSTILRGLNLVASDFNVLQDVWGARLLIVFVCIWAWSGFYILILLMAMKNIDPMLYKAAKIDGASTITIVRKILLPTLKPILILITVLATCSTFQLYIESVIITKGGPGMSTLTLVSYLYKKSYYYVAQYGYSSALAIIIFTICIVVTSILFILGRKHE